MRLSMNFFFFYPRQYYLGKGDMGTKPCSRKNFLGKILNQVLELRDGTSVVFS